MNLMRNAVTSMRRVNWPALSQLGRSRLIAAVDYDATVVRIVSGERAGRSEKISDLTEVPVPADLDVNDAGAFGEFLGQTLRRLHLGGAEVRMVVPRGQAVLKPLSLPNGIPDGEVPGAVQFQAEKELPFRADEAVVDFTFESHYSAETGEQPAGPAREVLVAAVAMNVVDLFRRIGEAGRFRLAHLGLRPCATARCVEACLGLSVAAGSAGGKPVGVVHVASDFTEISVLSGGSMVFSRSAAVKVPPATGDSAQMQSAVDEVTREAIRSLQSFQAVGRGEAVARVVVAGGTGAETDLSRQLVRRMNVQCEVLNPALTMRFNSRSSHSQAFVSALGMLSGDVQQAAGFDFLHPKRPVVRKDARKVRAAVIAAGIAVAILAVVAGGAIHLSGRRAKVAALETQEKALKTKADEIRAMGARLAGVEAWASAGQSADWLQSLKVLSEVYPSPQAAYVTNLKADVREATKQQKDVRLAFSIKSITQNKSQVARLWDRLKSAGFLIGHPGGSDQRGKTSEYQDGTSGDLFFPPRAKLDAAAVSAEPRPADDAYLASLSIALKSSQAPPVASPSPESPAAQALPDVVQQPAPQIVEADAPASAVASAPVAAPAQPAAAAAQVPADGYATVDPQLLRKASTTVTTYSGTPISVTAAFGGYSRREFALPGVTAEEYDCYELRMKGSDGQRLVVLGYMRKNSDAARAYQRGKSNSKYYRDGVRVLGRAWYTEHKYSTTLSRSEACPVAIVIDAIQE